MFRSTWENHKDKETFERLLQDDVALKNMLLSIGTVEMYFLALR